MNKRIYLMIAGGIVVLALGIAAIFAAMRLQQTAEDSQSVAPNVPQSQPKAQQQTLPSNPLTLTFNVSATASPGPGSASPTASPTASPAAGNPATSAPTATPRSTATSTPTSAPKGGAGATATPRPTATAQATESGKGNSLPEAGMTLPTIMAIIGGAALLAVAVFLAL